MSLAPLKRTCRNHYCFLKAIARSGGAAEWRERCFWMFQQTDGLYPAWGQKICQCFPVCCCNSGRLTVTSSPIKNAGRSLLVKELIKKKDPLLYLSCRWNLSGHIFPEELCCSSPIYGVLVKSREPCNITHFRKGGVSCKLPLWGLSVTTSNEVTTGQCRQLHRHQWLHGTNRCGSFSLFPSSQVGNSSRTRKKFVHMLWII
jgi:hypothetical protein